MKLSSPDYEDLKYAKRLLTSPSLSSKLISKLGAAFEKSLRRLPTWWNTGVQLVAEKALTKTLKLAVLTMGDEVDKKPSSEKTHKMIAAVSGGLGGAFGLTALAVELPISTAIMFRSIADIARSEGEDIRSIETRLACMEVFAYGEPTQIDGIESGYFAIRAGLSKTAGAASRFIAQYGAEDGGAPILLRLVSQIASRFGVVVSEKAAAISIPVLGAVGGAFINTIFLDHFQNTARGHFIIRRLEWAYGKECVEEAYERIDNC